MARSVASPNPLEGVEVVVTGGGSPTAGGSSTGGSPVGVASTAGGSSCTCARACSASASISPGSNNGMLLTHSFRLKVGPEGC